MANRAIDRLIDRGADLHAVNNDGETPLVYTLKYDKQSEVAKCLLVRGADINYKTYSGETPLIVASSKGNLEMVRYLVDRDADVNAVDNSEQSPLTYAVMNDDLEIVKVLVKCGADADRKTTRDKAALYLAAKHGHVVIRDFLLQHVKHVSPGSGNMSTADPTSKLLKSYLSSRSWAVSPFDIKLIQYDGTKTLGGEYCAKWLDADVVLKLFDSRASASAFGEVVTLWHQLRHPNVIKLYGACDVGHSLFVMEYANNGSVVEFVAACKNNGKKQTPWKFLYEAALGLAYLHERQIIHGNVRSSNILIGSDGVVKLTDFGLAMSSSQSAGGDLSDNNFGSLRWQAPEQIKGRGASFAADIYSFGLVVMEVVTGNEPWKDRKGTDIRFSKEKWDPVNNPSDSRRPGPLNSNTRFLISRLCAQDPSQRVTAATLVRLLEKLAAEEAVEEQTSEPELENVVMNVDEYKAGELMRLAAKTRDLISSQYAHDPLHQLVLREILSIEEHLLKGSRSMQLLESYHSLLVHLDSVLHPVPFRNRVLALSSSRAAPNDFAVFRRRMNDLWIMLGCSPMDDHDKAIQWGSERKKQLEVFVSDVSQTVNILSKLNDEADQLEFIALLRSEIETHAVDYSDTQLAVMKKAYEECCHGKWGNSVTTRPVWFLPWHELVIDRMKKLGEGGFGDVFRAKWLDSEVVVKKVKTLESSTDESLGSSWSRIAFESVASVRVGISAGDVESRRALRAMFEQEVDVWFGLSHPHVIRLFGACHVGTPFFACEYAGGGSLDKYLMQHPDAIWAKLYEAALGVQYLQSRGIIHGDLKCNNVMIGNDRKAKVTDFGLSSFEVEECSSEAKVSSAWQWVAPECIVHGPSTRSFASDVYSLGMCIVEALRVVEFAKLDKVNDKTSLPLPWGMSDNSIVKYHVSRQALPLRPQFCTDNEWRLVERMCAHNPTDRIKMTTVVDELALCAQRHEAREPEPESSEMEFLMANVISEMEKLCCSHYGNTDSRDRKVLCQIYALLWKRLMNFSSSVHLKPLVDQAQKRMSGLEKDTETLFAFTEIALRGYGLHRDLDKLIEAERWQVDEVTQGWRDRCWELLIEASG